MKKLVFIAVLGLLMAGCGSAAKQSEFWEHSSMYKNADHLKYSWGGYANTTPEKVEESSAEKWWGIPQGGH
ncbi:MAG: hypothetical protein AB7S77_23545 [Desulfatirhabdiaceae bacterium]